MTPLARLAQLPRRLTRRSVFYADDTLLISMSGAHLDDYLHCVAQVGGAYGVELHFNKLQFLPVRPCDTLSTPDGQPIPAKTEIEYLGAALAANGKHGNELSRRIGAAKAVFDALSKIWSHSSLTWKGKLRAYASCVESKLLCSLSGVCLNIAEQTEWIPESVLAENSWDQACLLFAGQQCSCLVQDWAHTFASTLLLKRQLQLFGKVLRAPEDRPLREISLIPGSHLLLTDRYVRRRGRPCK